MMIEKPTTQQMRQLVIASMAPAMEYQGMRRTTARGYNVRDRIETHHSEDGQFIYGDHRMGVFMSSIITPSKVLSKRVMHKEAHYFTRDDGAQWAVRAIRRFVWSEQEGVTVARRAVGTSADGVPLFADLRHGESFDDELSMMYAEEDFENITSVECDALIASTRLYYDKVAEIRRNTSA